MQTVTDMRKSTADHCANKRYLGGISILHGQPYQRHRILRHCIHRKAGVQVMTGVSTTRVLLLQHINFENIAMQVDKCCVARLVRYGVDQIIRTEVCTPLAQRLSAKGHRLQAHVRLLRLRLMLACSVFTRYKKTMKGERLYC